MEAVDRVMEKPVPVAWPTTRLAQQPIMLKKHVDARVCILTTLLEPQARVPMLTSQHEACEGLNIIALVELDWRQLRVRFFLARGAIRERMRELKQPRARLRPVAKWAVPLATEVPPLPQCVGGTSRP